MDRTHPAPSGESVHTAITRWARQASVTLLRLLGGIGTLGALVMVTVDWRAWPLGALLLSIGMVGMWGLVDQRSTNPRQRTILLLEALLAIVGGLAAALAGLGLLFWLLGPAPIL